MTKTTIAASALFLSACPIQPPLDGEDLLPSEADGSSDSSSPDGGGSSSGESGSPTGSETGSEGAEDTSSSSEGFSSSETSDSWGTEDPTSICGNGVHEAGEGCDDGPLNGQQYNCRLDCTAMACNDGILDDPWENCDPATDDHGTCPACKTATCGDGFIWAGHETCDDGNQMGGDGCSPFCQIEEGGESGLESSGEESSGGDQGVCGDYQVDPGEECDGGPNGSPSCDPGCTLAVCGDGITNSMAGEQCDDGNQDNTDWCAGCEIASCGDGFQWEGTEECDDANEISGDGCFDCVVEKDACGDPIMDGSVWLLFDWTNANQVKVPKVTVSDGYPSDWAPINKIIPSVHTSLDVLLNTNLGKAAKVRFNETMEFKLNLSPILSYDHATACVESWRIAGEGALAWFRVVPFNEWSPLNTYGTEPAFDQVFGKTAMLGHQFSLTPAEYAAISPASAGMEIVIRSVRIKFHGAVTNL